MSVSLVGVSASPVPTCSAASCGIWHPLKSPPPLLYRHTLTHTNTSTISWDKLGFCDFLQILPLIRENNLKALHRKRHEYKRTFLEGYRRKKIQQKSMQPGSWLLTWWLVTTSSCHTISVLVFAHLNCTLCWNSFITLQGMDTIISQGPFLKAWQSAFESALLWVHVTEVITKEDN